MSAGIDLENVCCDFGSFRAVDHANVSIKPGEFFSFLGPSGCGKTTTMRMIAGLEDATEGDILIGGRRVNDLEPKDRDIAMVFQSYALYPTMTVRQNMEFALKIAKKSAAEINAAVATAIWLRIA